MMPTYEYACEGCGHRFEEMQSFSEEPLSKCPACKKKKLKRLFGTGAAVLFKGSGFYETDYRSESYKADAQKDTQGQTGSSTTTATDTTSTPASGTGTNSGGGSNNGSKSDG
jgi:putative FmdB family regulatory protein